MGRSLVLSCLDQRDAVLHRETTQDEQTPWLSLPQRSYRPQDEKPECRASCQPEHVRANARKLPVVVEFVCKYHVKQPTTWLTLTSSVRPSICVVESRST